MARALRQTQGRQGAAEQCHGDHAAEDGSERREVRRQPRAGLGGDRVSRLGSLWLTIWFCAGVWGAESPFPARDSVRKLSGILESADFVHRAGRFRTGQGEFVNFRLLPSASLFRASAEADLRQAPLGAKFEFDLLPDDSNRVAEMRDTTTAAATETEAQRKTFTEYLLSRGLPAWINRTEGKSVTVTFISGDASAFAAKYDKLIANGQSARLCVANDELRTWNPPVDGEGGSLTEVIPVPTEGVLGCSGFQATIRVGNMLEGFRRGRFVRVFLSGWKAVDAPYGESLMGYGYGAMQNKELVENVAKEYPEQFPFRTDFGNAHLPWFTLKAGEEPPTFSEHVVYGSLEGPHRFLQEGSGQAVDFSLFDKAKVRYQGKDGKLEDIPPGTRCRFHLYHSNQIATLVSDDFSHDASNAITWRIEALHLDQQRLDLGALLPEVKNYNGDMERPEPFGHRILRVTPETKVWKLDQPAALSGLKTGDLLLANSTADLPGQPARCKNL